MGDILKKVKINSELTYRVPRPPEGTELLFEERPKKKQHWPTNEQDLYRDLDIPQIFFDWTELTAVNQEYTQYDSHSGELTHLSVDDTARLVDIRDRELHRRMHGLYWLNNGEVEFLTGNNYFFLVYYQIPAVGHPGFRKFQRDVFYVMDIALKDKNILGAYFAKAKKTGLSHIMASLFLNESTTIRDRAFGVMNKSQDEANDLNINFFWRGYQELPPIMQPQVSHKNLSKIVFGAPLVKFTGTAASMQKLILSKRNKPLDTWVFSAPTKLEIKFDGPSMYIIHLDEFPKWKVSQKKIFGKVTETIKLQQTINGKMFITSYPPEEDGTGFEEGKEIYYNSKLSTIKEGGLGRTTSGLICHFVSALDSTDGTFDIYGNANQDEALRLNQAERNQCKTPTDLQEKIRQYPRTEEECWRSGGSGSVFDNIHLAEAESRLLERERKGEILFTEGNLEWTNGFGSRVLFEPLTVKELMEGSKRGSWRMYERYSAELYLNRIERDTDGFLHPHPDSKFVSAADPTEYKPKGSVIRSPSNFSITVMSFPDVERDTQQGRTASNVVVCEYLDRMDDPDDDFDNLLKTIFYFGCYVLIEGNKAWVFTKMEKLGLQRFLLVRQKDGSIRPYEQGGLNQAVSTTEDVIETYCRLLRSYLRYPLQDEIDYCLLLKSVRLIRNLMKFDQYNTTESDDIVTLGLCRMAMAAFSVFRERLMRESKKDKYLANALVAICGND